MPPTMPKNERRNFKGLEFRAADEKAKAAGSLGTIFGYAAVFNSRSQDMWGMVELIKPGAFKKSLERGDDIRALFNHDSSKLLARRSSKTLSIKEDDKGLYCEIDVPDTSLGNEVRQLVLRGDLDGQSFGFSTIKDSWDKDPDGRYLRYLEEVDLFDVGPVTYPAYLATTAEARSMVEAMIQERAKPAPPIFDAAAKAKRDLKIKHFELERARWT